MPKLSNLFKFEILLILLGIIYYLAFADKGLVFLDEGYFLHSAERIFYGQMPYKDFSLQYGPTYFYILAFLFKIFQPSVIIGRYFAVSICILIIAVNFLVLNKLKVKPPVVVLSFLSLLAFGYPLINIPNIVWFNVLLAYFLILAFIYWLEKPKLRYVLLMGIFLALSVSAKQNFGLAFVILFSFLIITVRKDSLITKLQNLAVMQVTWIGLTFAWVYYFFLHDNFQGLMDFLNFSRRFATSIVFSYPPFTFLLRPLGVFKLLPYYLPIILFFIFLILIFKKYRNLSVLAYSITAVTGFFVSVYPQSDLLHVYPFLGMVLTSFLILPFKGKAKIFIASTIIVMILMGFYLTFFTRSYRYENYYYKYDTYLNLPRARGIMIAKSDAAALMSLSEFINLHTSKTDYIFVYPYSPILYFILERQNPSKDSLYFLPDWHFYSDKTILAEIKNKRARYIITDGQYMLGTDISKFIEKQKEVFNNGRFKVFGVKY